MYGIDLDKPILYKHSSLRFFAEHEWHIDRVCECDVLLLVFDGVLRFSEDGVMRELGAGEYYIQRRGGLQRGETESDMPRYLYIHFQAEDHHTSLLPSFYILHYVCEHTLKHHIIIYLFYQYM